MQKEGKWGLLNLEMGILINCQQCLIIKVIMNACLPGTVLGYSLCSLITINGGSFILNFSLFGKLVKIHFMNNAFMLLEHGLTFQSYQ